MFSTMIGMVLILFCCLVTYIEVEQYIPPSKKCYPVHQRYFGQPGLNLRVYCNKCTLNMNLSRYRYPPPPCVEPTYDQGYTPVYTQPLTLPNNAHANWWGMDLYVPRNVCLYCTVLMMVPYYQGSIPVKRNYANISILGAKEFGCMVTNRTYSVCDEIWPPHWWKDANETREVGKKKGKKAKAAKVRRKKT